MKNEGMAEGGSGNYLLASQTQTGGSTNPIYAAL